MNSTAKQILVSLVCSGAAIGGYHALLAPASPTYPVSTSDRDVDGALAALRREMAALRDEVRGVVSEQPTATEAPATPGAGALAARIAAIEQRLVVDTSARSLPAGVGAKPSQWTEQQIADFRSMLDTIDARKVVERETASMRQLMQAVAPQLSRADEDAAVLLLSDFARQVREVFSAPGIRNTPEDYVATQKKAAEVRAKMLVSLKELLSSEVVEKVAERLPTFSSDDVRSGSAKAYLEAMKKEREEKEKDSGGR